MATIAFVLHGGHAGASLLAGEAAVWLRSLGHEVRLPAGLTSETALPPGTDDVDVLHGPVRGVDTRGADLVVSLGGDGTMLRAVALVDGSGTPVLGVNLGHLGYLTSVEPSSLRATLERFLAGSHVVHERMALDVRTDPGAGGRVAPRDLMAFNDVVVEKRESGHTVRLSLSIGGRPFITYTADGLIVATPTGSTAYNLSSRGPIASPQLRAMIVTPVSPHMLFDRSLVLDPAEQVRVEVTGSRAATLVVDGSKVGDLVPGDAVICRSSPHPVCLVGTGEHDFHAILRAKFGLPDHSEH